MVLEVLVIINRLTDRLQRNEIGRAVRATLLFVLMNRNISKIFCRVIIECKVFCRVSAMFYKVSIIIYHFSIYFTCVLFLSLSTFESIISVCNIFVIFDSLIRSERASLFVSTNSYIY